MLESNLDPEVAPDVLEPGHDEGLIASDNAADTLPVESPDHPQPAITIQIQARATPILGLVLLIVGVLAGYFGRPLLDVPSAPVNEVSASESSSSSGGDQPITEDQLARQQQLMELVLSRARHFKGDESAPVTLVEFSDFQCPFCGRFASDAGRKIDEEYVATGQVRFGYVHFAFLGPECQWAAEASECAADQDAFWEYHDFLFTSQSGENRGAFNKENLKNLAVQLGLEIEAFNTCLDSGKYAELIQQETAWAQSIGVQSTPTFVLNGQGIIGAQPFEIFEQAIEAKLSP